MDELVRDGEYFLEEAMRERKPYFSMSVLGSSRIPSGGECPNPWSGGWRHSRGRRRLDESNGGWGLMRPSVIYCWMDWEIKLRRTATTVGQSLSTAVDLLKIDLRRNLTIVVLSIAVACHESLRCL
ncbi:hypothetical protein QJS10_CPB15g01591 [Acorus calamus]|uniref:Uncharacterized protein n=1 Tax=Acorus calamus TaxID=4465 RepID=A0AAV9D6S1_ACOCL|nr:hypothetical protein QJS10_CPB15g01591 [Acorus calamus]